MTPTSTITIHITGRTSHLGLTPSGRIVNLTRATMALIHNGIPLATWGDADVDHTLRILKGAYTCPIGDSLILDLYPASRLKTSAGREDRHPLGDVYLAIVHRDDETTSALEHVPLATFRRAVSDAIHQETIWHTAQDHD